MSKGVKILLIVIGAFAVLVLAAVIIIPLAVNPNSYKPRIEAAVKDATGRDLTIGGDISISVFPWIGARIESVTFGNAPGFGETPMLRVKSAEVSVRLMPLLSQRIEAQTVELNGVDIRLSRAANGTTNYDDLLARGSAEATRPEPKAEPSPQPPGQGFDVQHLSIGGLEIRDGNLVWDDRKAETTQTLSNVDVSVGEYEPGAKTPVDLSFKANSTNPQVIADVSFSAEVTPRFDKNTVTFSDVDLNAKLNGQGVPGGKAEIGLACAAVLDIAAKTATVDPLRLKAYNVDLNGTVRVVDYRDAPKLSGTFSLAKFSPNELMRSLGREPIRTSDPDALTALAARFDVSADTNQAALSELKVELDQTTLTGKAGVKNFSKPAISFDMAVDSVNADRYLPPKAESGSASSQGGGGSGAQAKGETELPRAALHGLDVDGKLRIGKLILSKLTITDILVSLTAKDGLLTIDPFSARLYDGSLASSLTYDARPQAPAAKVKADLKSVDAGKLIQDMTGKTRFGGKLAASANLTGQGETDKRMLRSLNGVATLNMNDGYFTGVNLDPEQFQKGKSYLPGESGGGRTQFRDLHARFDIKNGVARSNDLRVNLFVGDVTGSGSTDLAEQTVDYRLKANLGPVTVPLIVTGPAMDPNIQVDAANLLFDNVITKGVGKVLEVPEDAGKGLLDAIGGALRKKK